MSATPRQQGQGDDHYGTPPLITRDLLRACPEIAEAHVVEPCAGRGEIVAVLREAGCKVLASDLHPQTPSLIPPPAPLDLVGDLLDPTHRTALGDRALFGRFDWAITNPPYALADACVEACLELAPRVAVLMRLGWLEPLKTDAGRRLRLLEQVRGIVLVGRPRWRDELGASIPGRDSVGSAWVVLGTGTSGWRGVFVGGE